ncbi:hypothetical protein HU734_007010 [Pseudomonas wayambapalatensis]|nr:hypothetical protein HU734_007010 [Pseudomonas wayambapalatensis]
MLFTFYSGAKVRAWARDQYGRGRRNGGAWGQGRTGMMAARSFFLMWRARSKVGKIKDDWTVGCQVKHDRLIGFQVFIGFFFAENVFSWMFRAKSRF